MTTPAAIPLYVGYAWSIPVSLTNPDGTPLDISTWTIAGDLWLPGQSLTQGIVLPAMNVNVGAASFRFVVPKTTTANIPTQQPGSTGFPCRIMVNYTDATGTEFALRPIFILPLDPRSSSI